LYNGAVVVKERIKVPRLKVVRVNRFVYESDETIREIVV
jgi:hypothetical protein